MIPIIYGTHAGREKILKQRGYAEKEYPQALLEKLHKTFGETLTPEQAVARILFDVRARGDDAVREWTRTFDRVELAHIRVTQDEIDAAYAETPVAVRDAMELAASRIRVFHEKHKPKSWIDWQAGSALGQRIIPLARVGIYVPGGTAPLPSSLLMSAIPALVASVREVAIATPPKIAPAILAAAKIAGVSRVYAMGGAQAIAALAFGTASVARVDKIVGAGGLFTTLAKSQVFGAVGIDGLYGPTETMLIADDSANPAWVASDLLAQAEHDVLATAILITTSQLFANQVANEIEKQIAHLSRISIISQSLSSQGAIIVVENLDEAMELANAFAPEHLCLLIRDAWNWVGKVEHAGGIFVGEWTNEALGDYVIGPSHIMPTAGTARFSSPLNVNDFVKITSVFSVSAREAHDLGERAAILAETEGLTAHASAIRRRMIPNM
ncbi:MAG: histidinol dehydrogenase [Chloroflexi bacterium]|nr:histidinol dehydrogenase [Chloroflexota bacterium]